MLRPKVFLTTLARGKAAWVFVGVVFVAAVAGDWLGACGAAYGRADKLRIAGWILEVFGLFTVLVGVNERLKIFEGHGITSKLLDRAAKWIRDLLHFKKSVSASISGASAVAFAASLSGRALVKINPKKPIDEKLDWLLEQHYELMNRFQQSLDDQDRKDRELKTQLDELKTEIVSLVHAAERKLELAQVGGIGPEIVGIAWIFIGITMATVPELITFLFGWMITFGQTIGDHIPLCSIA